jgi:predicted esterase
MDGDDVRNKKYLHRDDKTGYHNVEFSFIFSNNTMKVLLLHGFMQNGEKIRKPIEKLLTKSIIKNHNIQLISPSGPLVVDNEKRGWWYLESKEMVSIPHEYKNVQQAIDVVMCALNDSQPDVVIGFSQGAVFATILLGLDLIQCKKVILLSGSGIMDERYNATKKIQTPSFHFTGQKDELVGLEESKKLSEKYENSTHHEHQWGHVVPRGSVFKQLILDTL